MYYVYILQSVNFPDKFYIGYTNDLKRRLMQHNNEHAGHTEKYRPKIILLKMLPVQVQYKVLVSWEKNEKMYYLVCVMFVNGVHWR